MKKPPGLLLVVGNDERLNHHRGPGRSSTRLSSSSTPFFPLLPDPTSSHIVFHSIAPAGPETDLGISAHNLLWGPQ